MGLLSRRARCVSPVRPLGEAVQLAPAHPGARSGAGRGEVRTRGVGRSIGLFGFAAAHCAPLTARRSKLEVPDLAYAPAVLGELRDVRRGVGEDHHMRR
eukprot:14634136-Alexandrium_andersonii.AAC.1